MDRIIDIPALEGWIPIHVYQQDQHPVVDWCYLGPTRFTDPFFSQTVEECMGLPFNLIFRHQTPIETLRHLQEVRPGFIFHMSRSGSTLVAQMLAALQTNIVISEPGPIDRVLGSKLSQPEATADTRVEWLRWLVSALGQPRIGDETHFFIKFDAWNILYLPLIRQAFPHVPWIFLYRDPVEVMVSQFSLRGAHMIPGLIAPELFGMDLRTAVSLTPDDYCARVLAAICQSALKQHQHGGRLINYTQLPEVVWTSIMDFFGVSLSESELRTMTAKTKLDAKNPSMVFSDDKERKKEKATQSVREAADRWLYPVYRELEAARVASSAAARS
jgi:sulfotransferase family protein